MSRARFCTAVLLTGPEHDPLAFGWKVGELTASWRHQPAGTVVVTNRLQHIVEADAHTWFVPNELDGLWNSAVHVHFREVLGEALTGRNRWPDWALFSPAGFIHAYDPHGPGHWVWRGAEAFAHAYQFDGRALAAIHVAVARATARALPCTAPAEAP
ncbi:hypothetical protein D7V97_32670 [Corallococcus sp. CA053C]|uniref:hypothetical protein n=1 Tax=Corallococcus sp. CA053C TaxID=2316732 RepID=UPI000ED40C1C|nr:hypothetical protein [Corallococcus sp. CA053C]RKG98660.1 hypothetical protein D7V97_32670 [Corallococcus sp. CA053C]